MFGLKKRTPPVKIFIGWDSREDLAFSVCRHSLLARTQEQIEVIPLKQNELRSNGLYWRNADPMASTEFTFTRFLVPTLSCFEGFSIFFDGDFLFLDDIGNLMKLFDPKYAVQVVQHNYTPTAKTKKQGHPQVAYPRKNWSSLIIWNNRHPKNRQLTAEVINTADASFLHQFRWLDDADIGALPQDWNWLVGWNREEGGNRPRALHFTEGGPWLEEHRSNAFVEIWDRELRAFLKQEYTTMHQNKIFKGMTWKKHLASITATTSGTSPLRILDYGCGPLGGLRNELDNVVSYDPFVPEFAKDPWHGAYHAVVSIDVLEHLSTDQLDEFFANIRQRQILYVFLVISLRKAVKTFSDGTNVHITVNDKTWWMDKLALYLPNHDVTLLENNIKDEELVVCLTLSTQSNEDVA